MMTYVFSESINLGKLKKDQKQSDQVTQGEGGAGQGALDDQSGWICKLKEKSRANGWSADGNP